MEERLRIALRRLGYDDAEVQLESAGGGMGGVLVSEKFVGLSQRIVRNNSGTGFSTSCKRTTSLRSWRS